MSCTVTPPKNPKPTKPVRKYKVLPYAKKIIENLLPNRGWDIVNGRYMRGNVGMTLRQFIEKLPEAARAEGLDIDQAMIYRGGTYNSIAIEQRRYIESEKSFNKRVEEYEAAIQEHLAWEALSPSEKKRIASEIGRQKKLIALQNKKDALKIELNKIVNEIDRTASNA